MNDKDNTSSKPKAGTDIQNFCSQKLWEMVRENEPTSAELLQSAIQELAKRRHYLSELEQLGKLRPHS